ncbi:MAG: glycosyltransferase [Ornithinimicrobium sp.]
MARRVLLVAWGSRGDVAPIVSLGRGLAAAGDTVSVLASRDFEAMITSAELRYRPFDVHIKAVAQSAEGRSWLGGHRSLIGESRALERVLDRYAQPMIEGMWSETGDVDVVISSVLTADACASLTRARGQSHALALLAPVLPSRRGASSPSALAPHRDSALNAAFGAAVLRASYRLVRVPGDEIRRRLGHDRTRASWLARQLTQMPIVVGTSPLVVPPAPDQPQVRMTGYWPPYSQTPSAEAERARIESSLSAARASGKQVVFLSFGSMTTADPQESAYLLVHAAAAAGVHAVIGRGWGDVPAHLKDRDDLTLVGEVPHEWLFAQCDAVVHHGGAGTTGSAIRAGRAQVVVAHMGDQPYWARRAEALGVAGAGLRRTGLTSARLAAAITATTTGPDAEQMRHAAGELAASVGAEDGVSAAVAALRPEVFEI